MSTDGEPFKTGLARGMEGKSTAQSVVDVDHFFDTPADRARKQKEREAKMQEKRQRVRAESK